MWLFHAGGEPTLIVSIFKFSRFADSFFHNRYENSTSTVRNNVQIEGM